MGNDISLHFGTDQTIFIPFTQHHWLE